MMFNNFAQTIIILGGLFEFFGCLGGVLYLCNFIADKVKEYRFKKSIKGGLHRVFAEDLEQF